MSRNRRNSLFAATCGALDNVDRRRKRRTASLRCEAVALVGWELLSRSVDCEGKLVTLSPRMELFVTRHGTVG